MAAGWTTSRRARAAAVLPVLALLALGTASLALRLWPTAAANRARVNSAARPSVAVRARIPPPESVATTVTPSAPAPTAPPTDLPLAGCPPPPFSGPPPPPPWHPSRLVADSALPPTPPPPPRRPDTAAIRGKGMWIWEFDHTEGGNAAAVVAAAKEAGLRQLWVRVADSQSGFYNADVLARLVPVAHRAGLRVIGWGFPYLYDPAGDATWSTAAMAWHSAGGEHLDGFSPDIETASEGVNLSARRVALYLGLIRQARPMDLLVATVFPPSAARWGTYPSGAIAPYVDALAPMIYWGCAQPVVEADQAISRLGPLAPLHLIGQAYDMGPFGGRVGPPAPAEITAFLAAARRGALGASLWSWQAIDPPDWSALGAFAWSPGSG